ncbi:MAG: response regulator transcription factor, partial [Saprospiraceae bacterium]|nr:response regulator transcription factor [Saprospiraceae bacterium]
MAYRLLIADDHQVIIDGFLAIFENVPEVEVVATARNGIEALEQLSKVEVDVILLDIDMPVLNGVETCKKISRDF